MIRINLLPVKRKKKPKPLPTFVVSVTIIAVFFAVGLFYLYFYYNRSLSAVKTQHEQNKIRIAELKKRIQEVDNFEKLNKTFDERNKVIEQLRRNQNVPAMMLDEISRHLPNGVWLKSMNYVGGTVTIEGYAFSNSEVVSYVDNLKGAKRFAEIYLQESKQAEIEKIPLYIFKMTFKVTI